MLSGLNPSWTHVLVVIVGAVGLDLVLGDPRRFPHPVRWMGRLIAYLDRKWNKGSARRLKGIGLLVTVVCTAGGLSWFSVWAAYRLQPVLGVVLEISLVWSCIAIKSLHQAAMDVYRPLKAGQLKLARCKLGEIVGRDTERLSEKEVARGAVETVAENSVDAITAPLFWTLLGGAPLAMVYRAVNTLDAMVGYKHERYREFGWASARMDDVFNWLPARLTAIAMWGAAWTLRFTPIPREGWMVRTKGAWKVTFRDAPRHPSPNSGWPEAMMAALLGVQLGGTNYYQGVPSHRPVLGEARRLLTADDISRSVWVMHGTWLLFSTMLLLVLCLWG
ncbi:cobalamin biosynthesis protein CobD [Caldalkalibacillus thermarum]|uniref:adenosylcobinamide-phosphate synthase CbiB n=1 Tax=Caldalkalibacillus thermarum TaxID=296745 RepID=UPI00166F3CCF|nr:adenosylcobinamide-phosphate synthase CbiB [Caldalkalibacillus thermarum]GGK32447.1 cobalamin biosynthesis protein CobD [Caldalkalibacillus thermarum]